MIAIIKSILKDKTIAIIGNAESIISSGYGEEIEAHDIVIRINLGMPFKYLKKDIGQRTDIWVIGGGDDKYSLYQDKVRDKLNPSYIIGIQKDNIFHIDNVIPIGYKKSVNKLTKELRAMGGLNPSTGCIILNWLFDNNNYKQLDIYGFDWFRSGDWTGGYNIKSRKNKYEDFNIEELYIKSKIVDNITIKQGVKKMAKKGNKVQRNKAIQNSEDVKIKASKEIKDIIKKEIKCVCGNIQKVSPDSNASCLVCQRKLNG